MAKPTTKREPVVQPLDQSYRLIPLTQGQVAKVDVEDFERLSQFNWQARWHKLAKCWYATRTFASASRKNGRSNISMHNEVMGGLLGIDHVDCEETLDNRKSNLRVANMSQQCANQAIRSNNTSGYKGVCFIKARNKWGAKVYKDYIGHPAGTFDNPEDAARAYDAMAIKLHGPFARVNFPA